MKGETREKWSKPEGRKSEDVGDGDLVPMSDTQAHRLKALCWQLGERFDSSLSAIQAERRIAELQARS